MCFFWGGDHSHTENSRGATIHTRRILASSRLQSEHEQIKVIAEQIVKYTETEYWIRAHESYVIYAQAEHSMIHRWKYL